MPSAVNPLHLRFGKGVSASGPRLADFREAPDRVHQCGHGAMAMIAGHGVVQRLPQALNHVGPRVIDGLREPLELGVVRQPLSGDGALVHGDVVHDEHDAPRPTLAALEPVQQVDEQQRVLALSLGPHHLAGARIQCAGQVVLLVLGRSRNPAQPFPGQPGRADSRVEVDVVLVGIEHLTVGPTIGQGVGNGLQALRLVRVANAQRRSCTPISESQALRALHRSPSIRCGLARSVAIPVRRTPRTRLARAEPTSAPRTDRVQRAPRSCPSPTTTKSHALFDPVRSASAPNISIGAVALSEPPLHCVPSGGLLVFDTTTCSPSAARIHKVIELSAHCSRHSSRPVGASFGT